MLEINKIYCIDALEGLKQLDNNCIDMIITSPPYWGLRDYGVEGQIGLEPTLDEYISKLFQITAELKRVLKPTGIMFWNHGDCYGGSWQNYGARNGGQREKSTESFNRRGNPIESYPVTARMTPKCMALQNERLILKMIDEQSWILRNRIIWHKPNHMPSSVKDRFTNAYEPIYVLVKSKKYWFDLDAVREPSKTGNGESMGINKGKRFNQEASGFNERELFNSPAGKNPGDVWKIPTQPYPEAHFATFPEKLIEPMIKAGCPKWICKECGKARVRIVKPTEEYTKRLGKSWHNHKEDLTQGNIRQKEHIRTTANYQTIGWTDCGCNAGWKAGIALDPFMGSGTVALIAKRFQRNYIGFDNNPEYVEMANKRIGKVQISMFD